VRRLVARDPYNPSKDQVIALVLVALGVLILMGSLQVAGPLIVFAAIVLLLLGLVLLLAPRRDGRLSTPGLVFILIGVALLANGFIFHLVEVALTLLLGLALLGWGIMRFVEASRVP
jgi:hypothetical protein